MGDRGEDMQQSTKGRNQTRDTAIRTEPEWYALYPVSPKTAPFCKKRNVRLSVNLSRNTPVELILTRTIQSTFSGIIVSILSYYRGHV